MKSLLLLLLLSLPLFAMGQSKRALEEKYGFRDMKFETASSAYPELVPLPSDNASSRRTYYSRPGDEMKIGDAILSSISYEFYDGKLAVISVRTEGFANSRALQDALRAQYGAGYPALLITDESSWDTKRVRLYYRRNRISGDAFMRLSSKVMQEEAKKGDAAAAKAAKSDL